VDWLKYQTVGPTGTHWALVRRTGCTPFSVGLAVPVHILPCWEPEQPYHTIVTIPLSNQLTPLTSCWPLLALRYTHCWVLIQLTHMTLFLSDREIEAVHHDYTGNTVNFCCFLSRDAMLARY